MGYYMESTMAVTQSFDTGQFADVQLVGNLLQHKVAHTRFWHTVGVGGSVTAAPILHDGTIYVGSQDKHLYALTLDGEERWRFPTDGGISMAAAVAGSLVCAESSDGCVYAVDAATGALRWKFATNGRLHDEPVVHHGTVFAGSTDGNLYALDAATGEERWRFRTGDWVCSPVAEGDRVYFGSKDGSFTCCDLEGHQRWRFAASEGISAHRAVVGEGMVFFGSLDHHLYALDSETGALRWKFAAKDTVYGPSSVSGGRVCFGGRDFAVYCLDARTGSLLWRFETGGFTFDACVDGDRVYVASWDNLLYCLDAATGALRWTFKTGGFVGWVSAFAGRVCFGSWDCHLYCLDRDGRLLWAFKTSMALPSPIAAPETAYVQAKQMVAAHAEERKTGEKYKETFAAEGGGASVYSFRTTYGVRSKYASGNT